jgi:hypothetical protein
MELQSTQGFAAIAVLHGDERGSLRKDLSI